MSTQQTNETDPWKKKELGVLWKKTKKGTQDSFLTGTINLRNAGIDKEIPVIIFPNRFKQQDNQPDLRIYISEPREGSAPATAAKPTPAPVTTAASDDNQLI